MALEGNQTILREERLEDQPFLVQLRNDLETQAWSKSLPPDYTLGMYAKRLEGREFSYDRREGRFIIIEKKSGDLVGSVVYSSLQSRWSATLGIIVAKPYWGGGYAIDALEVKKGDHILELGHGNGHLVGLVAGDAGRDARYLTGGERRLAAKRQGATAGRGARV